jgi:three-Cys-motif partner protein
MATDKFFTEPRENSKIKATIIAKYFLVWAKIIGKHAEKIAYIDLFAGPGRYKDDTRSTPLLVLESAIADPMLRDRLVAVFNDAEPENAASLTEEIRKLPGLDTLKVKPIVDNESVGDDTANALAKMSLIPTLCFFDPFGYKGLSLKLINAVLKDWRASASSSSTTTASIWASPTNGSEDTWRPFSAVTASRACRLSLTA